MFAIQVRGASMMDALIYSGNYGLEEKGNQANPGDIAVALVDGMETTLKRFFREPQTFPALQPANASVHPILVHPGRGGLQRRAPPGLSRACGPPPPTL